MIIIISLLFISSIAFFRAKDVFVMILIAKIVNFYIIPAIFLTFIINNFSILNFSKILAIIVLNILISISVFAFFIDKLNENKIEPDADFIDKIDK